MFIFERKRELRDRVKDWLSRLAAPTQPSRGMLEASSQRWTPQGVRDEEEDDDYENSTPPYRDLPPKPGVQDGEEDDDYENSTPPYRDLPPKPGVQDEEEDDDYENSTPPYRDLPPKPGVKREGPPLPYRPANITAPKNGPARLPGARLPAKPPPLPPGPVPPVPRNRKPLKFPPLEKLVGPLCLLLILSLVLSATSLLIALTKYQEVVKELRDLALEQTTWRVNVTGPQGLDGLRKDIGRLQANTNRSLVELQGLLECSRLVCPEKWLPFAGECYFFSENTGNWATARAFCHEHFSHLVMIESREEQNFVAQNQKSSHVFWLGLSDKAQEGDWKWLDGSPVTLSFWGSGEPNNQESKEHCGSMRPGGSWNDLPCESTHFWVCERKCDCV